MKKRSARWLVASVSALLASVTLIPSGLYIWHLEYQRTLQAKLDTEADLIFYGGVKHELCHWLPDAFALRLPETRIRLGVYDEAGMETFRRHSKQLSDVRRLEFSFCKLNEADLQLIVAHTDLEELELDSSMVTDDDLAAFTSLQQLRVIEVEHVPITDASLAHFACMPVLERLTLRDTKVTLKAAEAFAKANPHIRVGCTRDLTKQESRACHDLDSYGIEVRSYRSDYIAHHYRWHLTFLKDHKLTPQSIKLIQSLDGPIAKVTLETPLTTELWEFIQTRSTIESIACPGVTNLSDIEGLAALPTVKTVTFKFASFGETHLQTLYVRWHDKVHPWDDDLSRNDDAP